MQLFGRLASGMALSLMKGCMHAGTTPHLPISQGMTLIHDCSPNPNEEFPFLAIEDIGVFLAMIAGCSDGTQVQQHGELVTESKSPPRSCEGLSASDKRCSHAAHLGVVCGEAHAEAHAAPQDSPSCYEIDAVV